MEFFFASLFVGAVIFLFIALFRSDHIDKLNDEIKDSIRRFSDITAITSSIAEIRFSTPTEFDNATPALYRAYRVGPKSLYRRTGSVCPSCGRRLVRKNGRYGAFYGCSGYPNCSYTKQV